tara:strand:- start:3765 stop:4811 length:1047 start_codon:yes stop_codon:yes gene_type:complete
MTSDPNLDSITARDDMFVMRLTQIEKKIEAISAANNFYQNPQKINSTDEIDLKELLSIIWRGKISIILITTVFSALSVLYAINLPNVYRANATLVPSSDGETSNLAGLSGKFSGLASLGGVSLPSAQIDKTTIALQKLKSWNFIEEFIVENNIQKEVFAVTGWDKSSGELVIDEDVYDSDTQQWIEIHKTALGNIRGPNSWMLYDRFNDFFSVSRDDATGFISISIEYYSPFIAEEWVSKLISRINSSERHLAIKEAQENINFLESKINHIENFEIRNMFYRLLEEQTKKLMLSSGSKEYVLKVIEQAKIPEVKSSPKRALICIFGALLGVILGIISVLARHFSRRQS